MGNLKPGMTFPVNNRQMIEPMLNHLVTVTIDGQEIKARIVSVDSHTTTLHVVSDDTKE